MRKKRSLLSAIAACIVIPLLLQSCAYYNTYYNTQKYYKEALAEHKKRTGEQPTSQERQKFDKTIKQASKVLQFYPDSKYIDDSLMILGESFYYLGQYRKAERKFLELLSLFPDSDYATAAKLWLAKTHVQMAQYDQAETALRTLIDSSKDGRIRDEARYWLAECYRSQEKLQRAAEEYKQVVERIDDDELKFQALMQLGRLYIELEKYDVAAESFELAVRRARTPDRKFEANLEYGRALSRAGRYDDAIQVHTEAIDRFYNQKNLGDVKLELGFILDEVGDSTKAHEWYRAVIEEHPRTEAAAGAYLKLAEFEELQKREYKRARDLYLKAKQQRVRSDYAREADARAKHLKTLIKTLDEIAYLGKTIDNLQNKKNTAPDDEDPALADDSALKKRADETRKKTTRKKPKTRSRKKQLSIEDVDSLKIELAGKKILLAEDYLFTYNEPDSAINQYLGILSDYSSPEQRALAFYAIAYILKNMQTEETMQDSIYQLLALKYADTPQGRAARRELGLDDDGNSAGDFDDLYLTAERLLFDRRQPDRAVKILDQLVDRSPPEDEAPKLLYAMGWAWENQLYDYDRAYELYKKLTEKFPKSKYAKAVRKKVAAVDKERKRKEDELKKKQAAQAALDSTAADSSTRRLNTGTAGTSAPADSLTARLKKKPQESSDLKKKINLKTKGNGTKKKKSEM